MDAEEAKGRMATPEWQAEMRRIKDQTSLGDDTMSASEVFSLRLRGTRKSRDLTQGQLAQLMTRYGNPTSTATISRLETGDKGLTLETVFAATYALGAVPLHMLTPPGDTLIRTNPSFATNGMGMREWLISGFRERLSPHEAPPAELHDGLAAEEAEDELDERVIVAARALTDAVRIKDKAQILLAINALAAEVQRRDA